MRLGDRAAMSTASVLIAADPPTLSTDTPRYTLLLSTLGIVILILLVTYRSPTLWLLPIFSSMVALAGANALVYVLAKYAGLTVNGQSAFIAAPLLVSATDGQYPTKVVITWVDNKGDKRTDEATIS